MRYQTRKNLLAGSGDFWIDDDAGRHVYQAQCQSPVPGHSSLTIVDASGQPLFRIQDRPAGVGESMNIQDAGAGASATVKLVASTVRDRLMVDLDGGAWLDIVGRTQDHEYLISQGGERVAEVSRRWFETANSYGVEVSPGHDDALILAIAVCVERITAG